MSDAVAVWPIIGTDQSPAPAMHELGCIDWCNHCSLCGTGIMWGARCLAHRGVYPESNPTSRDSGS